MEEVDDQRSAADAQQSRRRAALAIEMLMMGVHGNTEQAAGLPLEMDLLSALLPDRGRAAAGDDEHQLFVQVPLGNKAAAWLNLDHVGVVERLIREVDEHASAALGRPGAQRQRAAVL